MDNLQQRYNEAMKAADNLLTASHVMSVVKINDSAPIDLISGNCQMIIAITSYCTKLEVFRVQNKLRKYEPDHIVDANKMVYK